jgi:hypothetical protein
MRVRKVEGEKSIEKLRRYRLMKKGCWELYILSQELRYMSIRNVMALFLHRFLSYVRNFRSSPALSLFSSFERTKRERERERAWNCEKKTKNRREIEKERYQISVYHEGMCYDTYIFVTATENLTTCETRSHRERSCNPRSKKMRQYL